MVAHIDVEAFERFEKINTFDNITSAMFNAYLISTLKFQFEKNYEFNYITSAMFNAYLISTLKFQFEKNYKFNYITSAMFNAYKISTLKLEKIIYFDKFKNSEKIENKNEITFLRGDDCMMCITWITKPYFQMVIIVGDDFYANSKSHCRNCLVMLRKDIDLFNVKRHYLFNLSNVDGTFKI